MDDIDNELMRLGVSIETVHRGKDVANGYGPGLLKRGSGLT